jgi:hypothetical protein
LVAIGWLERGKAFKVGDVDSTVFRKLAEFARNPWQPFSSAGAHVCDLCQFEGEARGVANLFIPGKQILYVCPELILHYMNAHGYSPPAEFCEAVLSCPPMRSIEYLRALTECGCGNLLKRDGIR